MTNLKVRFRSNPFLMAEYESADSMLDYPTTKTSPTHDVHEADARDLPLDDSSVDFIVTSPPYWQKRDYEFEGLC